MAPGEIIVCLGETEPKVGVAKLATFPFAAVAVLLGI